MRREEFCELVKPGSMMSVARIDALWGCLEEVRLAGVPGAIVQCGVWRGGVTLGALEYLRTNGMGDRMVWVYDTFDGMAGATEVDVAIDGPRGLDIRRGEAINCEASLEEFRAVVSASPWGGGRHLTIVACDLTAAAVARRPRRIAILYLDVDFFLPTFEALDAFWPLLDDSGVLIVDDYGHWKGCREAVDKFFARRDVEMSWIDYTGVVIRKAVRK